MICAILLIIIDFKSWNGIIIVDFLILNLILLMYFQSWWQWSFCPPPSPLNSEICSTLLVRVNILSKVTHVYKSGSWKLHCKQLLTSGHYYRNGDHFVRFPGGHNPMSFIFHIENQNKNIQGNRLHCTHLTHRANEKQIHKHKRTMKIYIS